MDVPAEDGFRSAFASHAEQRTRALESMPRPVGAATSQEGRVVDDDDLAEPLEVWSVERAP